MTARAGLVAAALVAAQCLAASALAGSGNGAYCPRAGDAVAGFDPLDKLGADAVRFSSAPALGGRGVVVALAEGGDGSARGTVTFIYGHPAMGWRREGTSFVSIRPERWRAIRSSIDEAMARGEPGAKNADGDIVVCTDGQGYLTERRVAGVDRWLSGFCGDHPNRAVARAMNELLTGEFAQF